ncbi:MAG: hypothetical protein GY757_51035 [bacterium]|nr:hypothetical protein [bacterium]
MTKTKSDSLRIVTLEQETGLLLIQVAADGMGYSKESCNGRDFQFVSTFYSSARIIFARVEKKVKISIIVYRELLL